MKGGAHLREVGERFGSDEVVGGRAGGEREAGAVSGVEQPRRADAALGGHRGEGGEDEAEAGDVAAADPSSVVPGEGSRPGREEAELAGDLFDADARIILPLGVLAPGPYGPVGGRACCCIPGWEAPQG